MEGVQKADFSYERAEGFVTYDTTKTSPGEFLAELARMTDYRGTVREEATGPQSDTPAPRSQP